MAITASIEPNHEFMERGGMSTSTRNAAKKIWPYEPPDYNEEMLARLLFCFENNPRMKVTCRARKTLSEFACRGLRAIITMADTGLT